ATGLGARRAAPGRTGKKAASRPPFPSRRWIGSVVVAQLAIGLLDLLLDLLGRVLHAVADTLGILLQRVGVRIVDVAHGAGVVSAGTVVRVVLHAAVVVDRRIRRGRRGRQRLVVRSGFHAVVGAGRQRQGSGECDGQRRDAQSIHCVLLLSAPPDGSPAAAPGTTWHGARLTARP